MKLGAVPTINLPIKSHETEIPAERRNLNKVEVIAPSSKQTARKRETFQVYNREIKYPRNLIKVLYTWIGIRFEVFICLLWD